MQSSAIEKSGIEKGELLYEYVVRVTGVTEFGVSFASLLAGEAALPACGARFDVAFEGEATGQLGGWVKGVDYLYVRPDGRMQLDIRAVVTTEEGHNISLAAGGVCLPRESGGAVMDLRENVTLFTSSRDFAWVNTLQVWAVGTVDLAEQIVRIKGYRA